MTPTPEALAAQGIDWQQVVLNGGPPCFHIEGERFCLRAQRWQGHVVTTEGPLAHKFISLAALLDAHGREVERKARLDEARWWNLQIKSRIHGINFYQHMNFDVADKIEIERIASLQAGANEPEAE